MSKNKFINLLCKIDNVSRGEVELFYDLFTQNFIDNEDIYNKPFLLVDNGVFFDIHFIASINLSRSFISLLSKENDGTLNNSKREERMLNNICCLINGYDNIKYRTNINIKDKSINVEGDIDLVIETENYIFVSECKSTLNITDYQNYNRVKTHIDKSFTQLDKIKYFLIHNNHYLSELGFSNNKKIVYITIITDSSFRGKLFNKYPVVSYKELRIFIEENVILFNKFYIKEKENNLKNLEKFLLCEYLKEDKLKFYSQTMKYSYEDYEFFSYLLFTNEVVFANDYKKQGFEVECYSKEDEKRLYKLKKYNFWNFKYEKYNKFCAKRKDYIINNSNK